VIAAATTPMIFNQCAMSGCMLRRLTFKVTGRRSGEAAEGTCKRSLQAVRVDREVSRHAWVRSGHIGNRIVQGHR
jgi:hypothetical protein